MPDPAVGIDQGPGAMSEVEPITRYAMTTRKRDLVIQEDPHGDWVRYLDHLALMADLRQQQEQRLQALDRNWHSTWRETMDRYQAAEASLTALRDWQVNVTSAVIGACGLEGGLHYEDVVKRVRELGARLRAAESVARRCEEENGAHCPEDRSCGETITALRGEQEQLGQQKTKDWNRPSCPCVYTTPCHERCTCVMPISSRGCRRCCRYGSPEQQKAAAERLVAAEATGEAAVSQMQKENDELKERLARVDGERRAAGPTGSTATTD